MSKRQLAPRVREEIEKCKLFDALSPADERLVVICRMLVDYVDFLETRLERLERVEEQGK